MPGRNSKLPVGACNSIWESFSFRPENCDVSSLSSKLPSRKTEFNDGGHYHLPAGWLNITCLGEILNFQSENAILLEKVSTSGRRIEIYLAEAFNFLVGRLSSTLLETVIIRPEDSIRPAGEKFPTSGRRMQCFVGKFQHPAGGLSLGLDRITTFGQRMWRSFESSNFRPENWDLPSRSSKLSSLRTEFNAGRNYHLPAGRFNTSWLGEILNFRSENAILLGKVWTFRPENWDLHSPTWELSTQKA